MDAKEFYQQVALKNYDEYKANPSSYNKLWNALLSANTVAEHVGLERLNYGSSATRSELAEKAHDVRHQYPALKSLNDRAITLKHVR
jgi:hypothetical protein